jgi:hypothetical protein
MTLEELAEICAAQEAAIQDVYAEYEWDRDPPYTMRDIAGQVVQVPVGPQRITWATARPFEDRFLWVNSTEWMDAQDHRVNVTETRSYNGEIGKYLQVRGDSVESQPSAKGTITRSRRFVLSGSTTPQHFTILRFREERPDYPLSEALRKTEWVDLIGDIQQIGPFRTIRVDLYAEGLRDKQGSRGLLSRMYFSVDHQYTPVQFELFSGNKVITRDVVSELKEVAPGIWYPNNASTTDFDKDGTGYTFACRASKIVVNQGLTPEFFDIDFPPGTKIMDEVLNSEYFIRPTEDQFNRWLETQEVLNRHRRELAKIDSVSRSEESQAGVVHPGMLNPEKDGNESGGTAPYALVHPKAGNMRTLMVVVKPFLLGLSLLTAVILGLRRWFFPGKGKTGDPE